MNPFITHVQLRVGDLQRSLAFYRDLLGFTVVADEGGSLGLAPSGSTVEALRLREVRGLRHRPRHPQTAGLYHVAWLVPSRQDLGRALDGLRRSFYPITGASDHAVSESLYLDDPDGNGVEIYADKPRATWQWQNGRVHMTVDPLDLKGLLESRDPRDSPILSAGTHIGHVHFVVPDLNAAKNYYVKDVGLDITVEWPTLVGLSHGGYHHHVNLNNWAGEGAPPDDPGTAGLDSVTMGSDRVARVSAIALSSRLATPEDLPELRSLMAASIRDLVSQFLDAARVEASFEIMGLDTQLIEDGTYFVVESGDRIAGCGGWSRRATLYGPDRLAGRDARLLDPATEPARIRAMYTHPDFVRRGVGRLVLSQCEAAAAREGFRSFEMMATAAGEPLYLASGYSVVERVEIPTSRGVGVPCARMSKSS